MKSMHGVHKTGHFPQRGYRASARRGIAFVYMTAMLTVCVAFMTLAIDFGRVTLAKSELQSVADAGARYAAMGMSSSSSKAATAIVHATAVCADSTVDGSMPSVASSDVTIGVWTSSTKTFTPTADESLANAVRITVTQTIGGAGSIRMFAQSLGFGAKTIRATAIATETEVSTDVNAPSQGNLWLAGMPDNTPITNLQGNAWCNDDSGNSNDTKQRPQAVSLTALNVAAGDQVTFEGISGLANNGGGAIGDTGPDGNLGWMVALGDAYPNGVPSNSANGIANLRAPISSCIAVFLSDSRPDLISAPSCLDFGTVASRDYTMLQPALQQPFFIGDGKTSTGEVQHIRVPAGATRVFLGMMDAWQWNDNSGSFQTKFYSRTNITTVK